MRNLSIKSKKQVCPLQRALSLGVLSVMGCNTYLKHTRLVHARMHVSAHRYTEIHKIASSCQCVLMYTFTRSNTYTRGCARVHAPKRMHVRTHVRLHTYTHTYAHTHMHIHTHRGYAHTITQIHTEAMNAQREGERERL